MSVEFRIPPEGLELLLKLSIRNNTASTLIDDLLDTICALSRVE